MSANEIATAARRLRVVIENAEGILLTLEWAATPGLLRQHAAILDREAIATYEALSRAANAIESEQP